MPCVPDAPVSVLVVDDQADTRRLIGMILRDGGVDVIAEADGAAAALERLQSVDPDVVVLDALMPLIDGFEAAARIRARRPSLPIVLLTGLPADTLVARARAAGVTEVLNKDDWATLPDLLRRVAGRSA